MKSQKASYLIFLLLILILYPINVLSQTKGKLAFNNIQKADGLPSNIINGLVKDNLGFLWIATSDGLCRYDGPNKIEVFQVDTLVYPNGLQSSNIRSIFSDKKDNLWLGTRLGGLTRYHQPTNTWTTFKHQPNNKNSISNDEVLSIVEDNQHRLWVGTENGLNLFDSETETFTRFLPDEAADFGLKARAILSILVDDKGWIWVGTWNGGFYLLMVDEAGQIGQHQFRNILPATNTPAQHVWKIYQDEQRRYWLGTFGGGLFRMRLPKDATNVMGRQNWQPQFQNYIVNPENEDCISNNSVLEVLEDNKGRLWVGTLHGLSIIENLPPEKEYPNWGKKNDLKFTKFFYDNKDLKALASNHISTIIEDEQGLIWLGTNSGVSQYNWYTSQFNNFEIFGGDNYTPNSQFFYVDTMTRAWVASGKKGLIRYDLKGQKKLSISKQFPHLFLDEDISSVYSPDDKWLYVGTRLGVSVINLATYKAKHYPLPSWIGEDTDNFYIQKIYVDGAKQIWINTGFGLMNINQKTGAYKTFSRDANYPNSLSDNSINDIIQDKRGNTWVATYNGLNRLERKESGEITYQHFHYDPTNPKESIISNQIVALEEVDSLIYIGTTVGLCSYNFKNGTFEDYSNADHKFWIQSIEQTTDGNLWGSTTEGIFYFDAKQKVFNVFDKKDGLGDLTFRTGASAKDKEGRFFFGSRAGITCFNPTEIVKNEKAPPVYITKLTKMNKKGEKISTGIYQDEITLTHNDYYLSIDFAALNYNRGDKNKYVYQLEGFDDNWHTGKFGAPITFTNLSPQTYTLKVKAANNDGVWNEQGAKLRIIKKPAYWETWWFKVALFLALLSLIGVGIALYTANIRSRNKLLKKYNNTLNEEIEERKKVEHTLAIQTEKIKEFNKELSRSNKDLEQYAYIASHDLKEPLRTIGNFSKLLSQSYKTKLDQNAFEYINFIEDGVLRMSNLINSLLTYSRVGRKESEFQNIDLDRVIELKLFDLSQLIKERNVQIDKTDLPNIYGERTQIGMVFYNLINNGIKFNKSKTPIITIKYHENSPAGYWQFSITDNGIGIDKKYQNQIFEIFRRLHSKQAFEGTGIGLSVCQKIINRHGGKIWLASSPNQGTTFYFTIKQDMKRKQLKKEDYLVTMK